MMVHECVKFVYFMFVGVGVIVLWAWPYWSICSNNVHYSVTKNFLYI